MMNGQREYAADLVICGGGTAGSAAAIAAADQGLQVLLIEQSGALGGSGSIGLVTPMMSTGIPGNPTCSYVSEEIGKRLEAIGAGSNRGFLFDPTMLGFVLEKMVVERGVQVLLHTTVTGVSVADGRVESVQLFGKSGPMRASARVFIDATGDGDVCALAGLDMLHGDEETGKNQPVSLRYIVGGVDLDAFRAFLRAHGAQVSDGPFSGATTRGDGRTWPLDPVMDAAVAAGDLSQDDPVYWQFFTVPGRSDCIAFNCPEFFDLHDADSAENQTYVQLAGKQAILRQLLFYRKYFRGFEHSYIASVSSIVGVRESRRAVTDYVITAEDLLGHRKFDDAICQSNYPVDVHGRKLHCKEIEKKNPDGLPYYEVPMRALIVRDVKNLMVAGRNLGAEFVAQSSIRIIPTCRAMGEAAGIGAAMACREPSVNLHALDGAAVRAAMHRLGAPFAQDVAR